MSAPDSLESLLALVWRVFEKRFPGCWPFELVIRYHRDDRRDLELKLPLCYRTPEPPATRER